MFIMLLWKAVYTRITAAKIDLNGGKGCLVVLLTFPDRVSLGNISTYPETHFLHQADLELTEIRLPLSPKCWD